MHERFRPALHRAGRAAPAVVAVIGVLAQAGLLVHHARRLWFFGDDWEFLLRRDLGNDLVDTLLVPHNEHWSTLPILAFRALFSLYGVGSYLPYALMPIAAHLVVCLGGYLVMRRAGLLPWPAALATLVTAFLAGGAGAENTLWDFQIGFLGACALGIIALWLAQGDGWRALAAASGCLVLSLMCAGPGLQMTAWACVFVLLLRGLRTAVLVGLAPGIVYVGWYLTFGHGHHTGPPIDLGLAPRLLLLGLSNVWGSALLLGAVGPVVLLVLCAAVMLQRRERRAFALAASGLVALVVAYAMFAVARSGMGLESAKTSRYVYFGIVFCAPAVGCAFQVVTERLRGRAWLAVTTGVLTAALVVALGATELSDYRAKRAEEVGSARATLAAAARIAQRGEPMLTTFADSYYSVDVDVDALTEGPLRGMLDHVRVSPTARMNARLSLQVRVDDEPALFLPPYTSLLWFGFADVPATPRPLDGCETHTVGPGQPSARVDLPNGITGGQVRVTASDGAVQSVLLGRDGQSDMRGLRGVSAGVPFYLQSDARRTTLRLFIVRGSLTVCPAP